MVLDKALPEKFVFAVIKKSESAELSKKRFDLVKKKKTKQNQRQRKKMTYIYCRIVLPSLDQARPSPNH